MLLQICLNAFEAKDDFHFNIPKTTLCLLALMFDLIFLFQHYYFFGENGELTKQERLVCPDVYESKILANVEFSVLAQNDEKIAKVNQ